MANVRARSLRNNQTDAEKNLWTNLRLLKDFGYHFRRQVPIDHLIVDFACYSSRLVIEVDGGQHNFEKGRRIGIERDLYLNQSGFRVMRFWNNDVLGNSEGVMHEICNALKLEYPNPSPQGGGANPGEARKQ